MKKILTLIFLLTTFCAASIFAQEKSADKEELTAKLKEINAKLVPVAENQCELFGKSDFEGTGVSIDVVDADLREVLILANPFGCNFTVDEKVEQIRVTVKVNSVPWNLVLQSILELQGLAIQIKDSKFRVIKAPFDSSTFSVKKLEIKPSNVPIYTEFVQLKNLKLKVIVFHIGIEKDVDPSEYEKTEKFFSLLKNLLSRYGAIEFDNRSQTFIFTDEKDRVKKIAEFVKLLDESGFTLEEIVNNPNFEIK